MCVCVFNVVFIQHFFECEWVVVVVCVCRIIQKAYISWNSGKQIKFSPELPIDIDFSKCFANFGGMVFLWLFVILFQ